MTTVIGGSSPSVTFPDSTVQNTAGLPLTGGTLSGPVNVPTLNAPSGVLATQNGMNGIAKAWVNWDGTTGTIRGSFNIGSVTRNSTGNYTVNFTTAMPSANYIPVTAQRSNSVTAGYSAFSDLSTTSVAIQYFSASNTNVDRDLCGLVVFSS